ncbi:MAG: hypothetical protein RR346_02125 [Bacteroidales bacterium]
MNKIQFSNGLSLDPEEFVYVELPPQNDTQEFNEDVWNYVRKGPDKPTLIRVQAKDVNVGESVFNLDGTIRAQRIA